MNQYTWIRERILKDGVVSSELIYLDESNILKDRVVSSE